MENCLATNVEKMVKGSPFRSVDHLIICTGSLSQKIFWEQRLRNTLGDSVNVHVVTEDWPRGAGNGLGTLYALQQAGPELVEALDAGASLLMYHTAGKGTRLAPLPASEYNSKSAVKLPGLIPSNDGPQLITLLEAVIRQTTAYAPSRRGRLSVFWGDQIFIPSLSMEYTPKFHVDILAKLRPFPSAEEWTKERLDQYGVLTLGANGRAQQVEKMSHEEICHLIREGKLSVSQGFGISLGSFSLSSSLVKALLKEFQRELSEKRLSLSSDVHFWMPMTLDRTTYTAIAEYHGMKTGEAGEHHRRMLRLKENLLAAHPEMPLLGAVDVGKEALWWDYGQVSSMMTNHFKLLDTSQEAALMRQFFAIDDRDFDPQTRSLALKSSFLQGHIRGCVLAQVHAKEVNAEDSILIDCVAPVIQAEGALLYNALDPYPIDLHTGDVRADLYEPEKGVVRSLKTTTTRNGKEDWSLTLPLNDTSFAAVFEKNEKRDCNEALQAKSRLQERLRTKI